MRATVSLNAIKLTIGLWESLRGSLKLEFHEDVCE